MKLQVDVARIFPIEKDIPALSMTKNIHNLSVGVWERFDRYDKVFLEIKEASSDALQLIDHLDETLTNTSQEFEDRVVKAMDTTSAYLKEQFESEAGILDLLLFLSSSDPYTKMESRLDEVLHKPSSATNKSGES
jgi:hypothetical protein